MPGSAGYGSSTPTLGAATARGARARGSPTAPPARVAGRWPSVAAPLELVGRGRERAELAGALATGRPVTLTGLAGTGKTRLALEAAARPGELADGAVVVELEGIAHPSVVIAAVAEALGEHDLFTSLPDVARTLSSRELLLVLDGADDAAGAAGTLVGSVVTSCTGVRVLTTCRRALRVPGEQVVTLRPLSVPPASARSPELIRAYEAPQLLARRAQLAVPELTLGAAEWVAIARICRELAGIPVALEIAGALAASGPLVSLADELHAHLHAGAGAGRVPPRRALDALIAWSIGLLDPVERQLLEHLAVFAGGSDASTLWQLLAASGAPPTLTDVVAGLAGLVDRSIAVVRGERGIGRYALRALVRRQVVRQLDHAGRLDALTRAHLEWCLHTVQGAEDALVTGAHQAEWLDRLSREQRNIRAALGAACRSRDGTAAARLATELWRYWELRNQLSEGRRWLEEVLAIAPAGTPERVHLLDGLGMLAWRQGDSTAAEAALSAARALALEEGRRGLAARALNHLGLVALFAGDLAAAAGRFAQCLAELADLDAPGELALVTANVALVAIREGRYDDARRDLDATASLQLALGDRHGRAISLLHRAIAWWFLDARDQGQEDALEAATTLEELGDDRSLAFSLLALAACLAEPHPSLALEAAGLAEGLRNRLAVHLPAGWDGLLEAALAPAHDRAGARAEELAHEGRMAAPRELLSRVAGAIAPASGAVDAGRWASISVLGGFEVWHGSRRAHLEPQVARLVQLLVVERSGLHVEQAIEVLWPEVPVERGRRRLRNVLSRLHRAAGPVVVRRGDLLALGEGVDLDAARFEAGATQAIAALRDGAVELARRQASAAVAAYRGDLLPDALYEPWSASARERLRRLRLGLLDAWAQRELAEASVQEAERCLRAAIDADPVDEDRWLRLAELLAGSDRPAAALDVLARARAVAADLGVPVSSRLARLEQQVRGQP
jgi:predicted ATPase/DNA-binding SARP family transcriptional activator